MRLALVVGINYYNDLSCLYGCVNDAIAVSQALQRHGDGSVNFDCKLLTVADSANALSRASLKDKIAELFRTQADIALLYFAGHGHIEPTGGYLLASDATRGDDGLPLSEVQTLANGAMIRHASV